jgi:hypothetical protein
MTTLLTPKQHRILARNLIKTAGTPGHPNKKRAKEMAQNHENIALMIERREALTPEQHRVLAADFLKKAGTSGYLTNARAKQMAQLHENMAAEKRAKREAASQGRPASHLR